MTEYKKGDEILIRVRHVGIGIGYDSIRVQGNLDGMEVNESEIYSLAPEFNVGELVEFSNNTVDWYSRCFGAYVPTLFQHPHFSIDGCSYRYARKLQPKDEPVTAEEIYDYVEKHPNKDLIDNLVEHFKGRRIGNGGDK